MARYIDADKLIEGRVENDPVVIAANCELAARRESDMRRDVRVTVISFALFILLLICALECMTHKVVVNIQYVGVVE